MSTHPLVRPGAGGRRPGFALLLLAGLGLLATEARAGGREALVGLVNLNEASEAQLCLLPGVGATRARAVIEYRRRVRFGWVGQLRRVKGFGPKTLQRLRPFLRVEGATTLARAPALSREPRPSAPGVPAVVPPRAPLPVPGETVPAVFRRPLAPPAGGPAAGGRGAGETARLAGTDPPEPSILWSPGGSLRLRLPFPPR